MTRTAPTTSAALSLRTATVEVEHYVGDDGWDQPGRLFALVPTADLVEAEPDLAMELGVHSGTAEPLTPVEQEIDGNDRTLEELLSMIAWPPSVVGVLAVVERVVLPPSVETDVPDDEEGAVAFAAQHTAREDVRIVAGVLRSGEAHCLLRLRSRDDDDDLLHGEDLVPQLVTALRETLEDEQEDDGGDGDEGGPDE
ncbi:MAG: PPA1309 family protein [Nocardioidaceae bacterium]